MNLNRKGDTNMKLEQFNAGEYIKVDDYKSFIPNKINYD